MKPNLLFLSILMIFLPKVMISQELLVEISLQEQIAKASKVVEGEVVMSESFWNDAQDNIYTRHRIQISKVFKGVSANEIDIITLGGVVGLEAMVVSNALELDEGDMGVFILNDTPNSEFNRDNINSYIPYSDIQSFYKYSAELNLAANIFKSYSGIINNFHQVITTELGRPYTVISDSPIDSNINAINANRSSSSLPVISSFSSYNTTAGTKTILTINGSGFGTEMPTVGFCDANYGGALFYDVGPAQIVSWSDTEIEVEIPDRAGTGAVRVMNSDNQYGYSTTDLTVDFAQINLDYNNIAYQTQHINTNNEGGFTWQMNTDFESSLAVDPFVRGLDSWSCESGINWDVALNTTTANSSSNDGINVVTFDDASPLPPGVLGRCTSRYSGCPFNGEVKWYVDEMDIVFNSSINWNFSTSPPASNEVDFESVAVHELGHGQQLGHVINDAEVMHFSMAANVVSRTLSPNDIQGANDIQDRSSTIQICGQSLMEDSSCSTLSTTDVSFTDQIIIYPNPVTSGVINIKSANETRVENMRLYNTVGELITSKEFVNNGSVNQLHVSTLSTGLYVLQIETNQGIVSKKILLN
ncbi:hypothetical protein C1T31_09525 [Hanstruepera neustonica]|uniref:Secretion system C-terminal sorting domain-containing protein n=1 Tax=Hanstruepera neustonica TaxID=1445657 RepID=A0A2K1DXI5_9FLAO|nr:T9SS type A sorting domain-containing protein [Hanstruepera neustonica]PNQ72746.1 hypothetical protein C1T31_09525 [Hanstruepera neustonica]